MKFINHLTITDFISGYYIDPVDMCAVGDLELLKVIIEKSVERDKELFFLCYNSLPENSFLNFEEMYNQGLVSKYYQYKDPFTAISYWTIAANYDAPSGVELIKILWQYFEYLRWFVPNEDLDWQKLISYETTIFEKDEDGKKLLNFNFTDVIFIKGSGGESLSVNYKNHLNLRFYKILI